jgi:hypothetical protein
MSLQSASPHRERGFAERVQAAIQLLRACSPKTLRVLGTELVKADCANCSTGTSCDACDARAALTKICFALAALAEGEL